MSLPLLLLLLSILVLLPKLLSPLPPQSSHLSPHPPLPFYILFSRVSPVCPFLAHVAIGDGHICAIFCQCKSVSISAYIHMYICSHNAHFPSYLLNTCPKISHYFPQINSQNFPIIFLQSSGLSTPTSPFPASVFHFPDIAATHRSFPAAAYTHTQYNR